MINLKGELVGLTTMASSPAGFDALAGYAIPMDKIGRRAVETSRKARRSSTACSASTADHELTRTALFEVQPNSPAALGQLQVNDEIIAVNDMPVIDFDTLILAVNAYSAGDTVRLKIRRGDETIERTIVLAKFPVEGEVIATNRPKPWRGLRVDYTIALAYPTFGPNFLDPHSAGRGRDRGRGGIARGRRRHQEGPVDPRVGDNSVRSPTRLRRGRRRRSSGPVTLETDLGHGHSKQHENRRTSRSVPRILRVQGLRPAPQRRARAQRPDRAVHAGRDEPVQARVHGAGRPQLHAGDHLPEVHPHRRHRERRQDRVPRDVLRDAGELQLRRLLQARGDPLGLGVLAEGTSRSPPTG